MVKSMVNHDKTQIPKTSKYFGPLSRCFRCGQVLMLSLFPTISQRIAANRVNSTQIMQGMTVPRISFPTFPILSFPPLNTPSLF